MNLEKAFESYLRGWFPQEPALRVKSKASVQEKMPQQQQNNRLLRVVFAVITGLIYLFTATISLVAANYVLALINFAGSALLLTLAYGIYKYNLSVRARFAVASAFMLMGAISIFFNDAFLGIFAFPGLFATSLLGSSWGVAIFLGIVTVILVCLTIIAWLLQKERLLLSVPDNPATKRQLLKPFTAAAIMIFSTYLVIISGLEYEYAIPLTFIIIGVLVLRGLGRFAITTPAFLALVACMLLLGATAAGAFTVTYVSENYYLTTKQAPNADLVNVTVKTLQADIRVYFTDDDSKICQVAFIKQYGPTAVGRAFEFHPKNNYDRQPANNFNYIIQDGQVIVYADSYRTLVNVTLNQNLKYNLTCFSYFGGITISSSPEITSIQSSNLTSQWGYVQTLQNQR